VIKNFSFNNSQGQLAEQQIEPAFLSVQLLAPPRLSANAERYV
jgi:hypothetical protein